MVEHSELSKLIKKIYQSFNLNIKELKKSDFEYLEYPDTVSYTLNKNLFSTTNVGNYFWFLSSLITAFSLLILPICAQIFAFINVEKSIGLNWWLVSVYFIIILIEVVFLISILKKVFSS